MTEVFVLLICTYIDIINRDYCTPIRVTSIEGRCLDLKHDYELDVTKYITFKCMKVTYRD